jgi:pimeloyl-ACP methyl ester carboxylesterase
MLPASMIAPALHRTLPVLWLCMAACASPPPAAVPPAPPTVCAQATAAPATTTPSPAGAWALLERNLPGTWTMATAKGPFPVAYRLVAGESALVEDWGPGTAHETETVFHPDHADVLLVHYCAQGNQPRLRATAATADSVVFSFVDVTNRAPSQAMLVERRLRFAGDAFDDTEVYAQPDGTAETTTYHFTRASPSAAPSAVSTDPAHDEAAPARFEVLHIPTGGVEVNGLAYVAAGPGPHPSMVLLHGLPGNEKNLDLAQAVRRAGWTVVTLNYRGSWGSPGAFGFAHVLEDARAALAYVREPKNAARLGIDPRRVVLAGHSMGGWATALTAAADHELLGAVLVSAADLGALGHAPAALRTKRMKENHETLAGTSPPALADEVARSADAFSLVRAAQGIGDRPVLVLTADDGLAAGSAAYAKAARDAGDQRVVEVHAPTDHAWSDRRVFLASTVVSWLQGLPLRSAPQ